MDGRSWTAAAPRLYDAVMQPIEALGVGRWRAALWADVPRTGTGLEVGAGSGASAPHRPAGTRVVASDLSHAMLRRARERGATAPESGAAPLVTADVQALPFADASFDWVVGSLLFCEVPDPLGGLRELRRVLRPDGSLHLFEHVRPSGTFAGGAARLLTALTGPLFGEHFDRLTHKTVEDAGFRLVRTHWGLRGALVRIVAQPGNEPGGGIP